MDTSPLLQILPWVVAAGTGGWAVYQHFHAIRKEERAASTTIDMHRDDLALTLLSAATSEIKIARTELEEVRQENKALRSIEEHFYHFQQALDHLEAILSSGDDVEARAAAERNARAFLDRMKRVQQAKGTIQNETQVVESAKRVEEREKKDDHNQR